MRIENSINYVSNSPCVLALGCFDGVHKGHKQVIDTARAIAQKNSLPLSVFSFDFPPRNFFVPGSVPNIITCEQKLKIFEQIGVDVSISVMPSREIFEMTAEDFIKKIIIGNLKAKAVVCGFNYSFGKGGRGNSALLKDICAQYGVDVTVIDEYTLMGSSVSSSAIRIAVANGDMEMAREYLGRAFSISATVIDGQHLARRLGFPTVNVIPPQNVILPRNGVYVTRVKFDSQEKYGISNVGYRPTVNIDLLCVETHILDFSGDLYGKEITVEFLHFLRDETKFNSVELLAKQVEADIASARTYVLERT